MEQSKITATSGVERKLARTEAELAELRAQAEAILATMHGGAGDVPATKNKPFVAKCPAHLSVDDWARASVELIKRQNRATQTHKATGSVDIGMFGVQLSSKRDGRCVCCGSQILEGERMHFAQLHPGVATRKDGSRYWVTLRAHCFSVQEADELDENLDRVLALLEDGVTSVTRDEADELSRLAAQNAELQATLAALCKAEAEAESQDGLDLLRSEQRGETDEERLSHFVIESDEPAPKRKRGSK